jgi:uncharacterized membrane protein
VWKLTAVSDVIRPAELTRVVLLGVATGSRSSFGPAALVLSSRSGWASDRRAKAAFAVAAAAEVVIDKLPATPSRLQPRGLIARAVSGAASGALLTHSDDQADRMTPLIAAGVGSLAALAGAVLGASGRRLLARRTGHDLTGAMVEDLVASALAVMAVNSPFG